MTLVVARLGLLLIREGVLPPQSTAWRANPAATRLAELIGVTTQSDLADYWDLVRVMNTR